MENFLPAVCYHPTTVLLVDDNRKFLDGIQLELDWKEAYYRPIDDPQLALDFLTKENHVKTFFNCCLNNPEDHNLEHITLDLNVRAIHHHATNPKRFTEISVAVIDYAMPRLNGLELCTKLKGMPFKKIMLTCEADEALAIQAFNQGLIDKFIRKDCPGFATAINDAIQTLQKKYFHSSSQTFLNIIKNHPEHSSQFLTDSIFIGFFEELKQKLNVVEYYLMDSSGSFMFLNKNAEPKWLAVKNELEMDALTEFAISENAPKEVIEPLRQRRVLPYFHSDEDLQTPPANWGKFFHPAQKLDGKETYYYSVITNSKAYQIEPKLASFADFKRN